MHVPNHMITNGAEIVAAVSASAVIAVAAGKRRPNPAKVTGASVSDDPARGAGLSLQMATAALVFALQMVNFPVLSGTSGHLLGGALATALIGPRRAVLAVSAVVVTQALLFADGGIGAIGVNLWLIAIIPVAMAVMANRLLRVPFPPRWSAIGITPPVVVGAVLGPLAAAAALSVLYALAGTGAVSFGELAGSMVGVHARIGVGEAVITVGALASIHALPRLRTTRTLPGPSRSLPAPAAVWATAGICGAGLSLLASSAPDGLERVIGELGIAVGGSGSILSGWPLQSLLDGPFDNYQVAGLQGSLSTSVAALIGLGATAALLGAGLWFSNGLGRTGHDGSTDASVAA